MQRRLRLSVHLHTHTIMLYRRHLRIKVLQALYAWYTSGSDDLNKAEKQLLDSIDLLYKLFVYQISFLVEVKRFAEKRMLENKEKFYPTEEDLNPNLKFVENRVVALVEENSDFLRKEELFKINWADETDLIRLFYKKLRKFGPYMKYMDHPGRSLDEDKKLFIQIADQLFPGFDLLRSFYEEKSIYFVDGYDLVNILLIKFFEITGKNFTASRPLPGIYKHDRDGVNEDREFVRKLFRKTILQDEENTKILASKTSTWDYDRIPLMDIILLKMAIVELKEMETVPVKVTLNEYIELSKYFSAAKSKTFVNGVLDRLIKEFNEDGKIHKTGRGLIN
ncbi:MAG TPA: transcription antitermination factor NusB [Bacteroidetes bacterium]|nr:transcription antitermination factor NusB [Bacteroidota bacterium]